MFVCYIMSCVQAFLRLLRASASLSNEGEHFDKIYKIVKLDVIKDSGLTVLEIQQVTSSQADFSLSWSHDLKMLTICLTYY